VLIDQNTNGWDPSANGGKGGVHVNWVIPAPHKPQNAGHDIGEDLRLYENMLYWKPRHLADTSLDAYIARMKPIAEGLFLPKGYDKSWAWLSLLGIAAVSGDDRWSQAAYALCQYWLSKFDAKIPVAHGSLVASTAKGAATIADGYRVDAAMQIACGLIAVGTASNDTAMVSAGEASLAFVHNQAFVSKYGLYARIIENPAAANWSVYDWQAKAGEQGQTAWCLAAANQTAAATALLTALEASPLHDTVNGGFWFCLHLDTGALDNSYKEAGRCMTIARAALLTGNTALRDEMFDTGRKAYHGPSGTDAVGYVYQTDGQFAIYKGENWLTSESDNITLLAFQTAA
jgi:hypothetical protein